ncbi:MAG: HAD hydrolase family protein, partial [Solobacterium sp.]|nr:HAD hydrolase family protein [Solobacterium sp.]
IVDSHGDIERLCPNPVHTLIYRYYEENQKEVMDYIHDYLNQHPDTVYTRVNTYPGIVEIIHKECNKGAGVKVYCEKAGIPLACTVGMGDMDNDIGLMSGCGIGVAMANGSDATKAAAEFVTEHTCDDDGMGRFLFENWIEPLGWK